MSGTVEESQILQSLQPTERDWNFTQSTGEATEGFKKDKNDLTCLFLKSHCDYHKGSIASRTLPDVLLFLKIIVSWIIHTF